MSISCDATIKWKVCMYTLLNMLLLRVVKRLSFRIDELDCNLAPQCLHVAKTCLWCGFPFPSCSHKKCENFSVSYVTRITPKYLENGTIVFRNASVKETQSICLLAAICSTRDRRCTFRLTCQKININFQSRSLHLYITKIVSNVRIYSVLFHEVSKILRRGGIRAYTDSKPLLKNVNKLSI